MKPIAPARMGGAIDSAGARDDVGYLARCDLGSAPRRRSVPSLAPHTLAAQLDAIHRELPGLDVLAAAVANEPPDLDMQRWSELPLGVRECTLGRDNTDDSYTRRQCTEPLRSLLRMT